MANTLKLRFSSIKDFFSNKSDYLSYEMEAPYTDTYKVSFKKLKSVVIYNEKGIQILLANKDFEIDLTQGQIIKVVLYKGSSDIAELKVMALNHKAVLPYDPYNPVNTRKLRTHGDNSVDPLTPVKLNVKKRDDGNGLYINCNNPEKLTENDIGKALSRVNITSFVEIYLFISLTAFWYSPSKDIALISTYVKQNATKRTMAIAFFMHCKLAIITAPAI